MPGTVIWVRRTLSIVILLAGCGGAGEHDGGSGSGGTAGSTSHGGASGANAGTRSTADRGGASPVGSGGSSAVSGRAGSTTLGTGGTGSDGRGGSSSAVGGVSAELGGAGGDGGASGGEAAGGASVPNAGSGGDTSWAGGGAGDGGEGGGAGSLEGPACPAAWTLGTAISHRTPDMGEGAFIADLNADGRVDLVALTWTRAVVFLQDEKGTLVQSGTYPITKGYNEVAGAVGDFNGDGAADLIVASIQEVQLFLNDGHGAFGASKVVSDASPGPGVLKKRMRVRDIDGDGALDATLLASPLLITYYGDGHGGIARVGRTTSSPEPLADFALLDLGGDHHLDVVGLSSNLDLLSTVQTAGGFDQDWQVVKANIINLIATSVEAGDLDGDGLDDIVVSGAGNQPVQLRLLFAREGFGTIHRQPTYDIPQTVAVTDIDGNGSADLLVLHGGWENIGIYNRCQRGLENERLFPIPFADQYAHDALAIGDLNSDGCPDVAIADYNHGVSVLLAQGCAR